MDDEINLLDYWRVIVKRKVTIVVPTILIVFIVFIFSSMQPKQYMAVATIMPTGSSSGGLAIAVIPFLGGGGGEGDGKLIPILQSFSLAHQVAQEIDLQKYFPKIFNDSKLNQESKINNAASSLRGAITARNPGVVLVSIVWSDPEAAADIANLYVKQLGLYLNKSALNINFQVLDLAMPSYVVYKPKIQQNVFIGGLIGIFIGIFVAFFLEYIEKVSKH